MREQASKSIYSKLIGTGETASFSKAHKPVKMAISKFTNDPFNATSSLGSQSNLRPSKMRQVSEQSLKLNLNSK